MESLLEDALHSMLAFLGPEGTVRLSATCSALRTRCLGCAVWREFAIARWGHHVPPEDAMAIGSTNSDDASNSSSSSSGVAPSAVDWHRYYIFRVSRWAPPTGSPLDLIQEHYCSDPWRLIACCLMTSRTSGGGTVRSTIDSFLSAYPTPSHVLSGDLAVMEAQVKPLGLHREATLLKAARGFLSHAWTGGQVCDLYGCGAFVNDSWRVFCLGPPHVTSVARDAKADRNVRAYAAWAVSQAKSGASSNSSNSSSSSSSASISSDIGGGEGKGRDTKRKASDIASSSGASSSSANSSSKGADAAASQSTGNKRSRSSNDATSSSSEINDERSAKQQGDSKKRKRI